MDKVPEWSSVIIDGKKSRQKFRDNTRASYKRKNTRDNEGRLINSREYAIAWGVINKPYSYDSLRKLCGAYDAPSFSYILKEWKHYPAYYKDLVRAGMEPKPPKTDAEKRKIINPVSGRILQKVLLTQDYDLAEYCAKMNVINRDTYNKLRDKSEIKMPNYQTVARRFGSFTRFMNEVRKYSLDLTITVYVKESMKVGHWLRLAECDKLDIPIRKAMDILRPKFFNTLCYKKMELLKLQDETLKELTTT
jgi:hypothetical protein